MNPNVEFISFDGQHRDYGVKPNNINIFSVRVPTSTILCLFLAVMSRAISIFHSECTDIVPNSDLTRYTFNLRGLWKRLELDAKINFSLEDINNRPYLGYSGTP